MSAHLPELHAPRWLRERLHEGREHRAAHCTGRGRVASVLPFALVAALSVGSWLAQIGDVAASGAPLGVRMVAGFSADSRVADDAGPAEGLSDMPPASVDAITL
jgi:hypothetical protein